ncbi:serine hydrolase domain-containing protein [Telmatospirillum sp.]|uniref:serine hydrolase domain-containing protein n=1 Tax=Telmatospirillum sp. TaxID=2079197 RepID=UPI00284F9F44|nr:serine hydrolase domain-containing protein [Telmatospirillum sp.]MDR3435726.1 serine hydrolase [Telmatospirillum sp.]
MTPIDDENLSHRITAVVDGALAENLLVGAVVLVARDGRVVYRRAAGLADRENGRPMRDDTIFRYSSLTKPIVAAAAMALIEQGRLRLDDTVTRWLPDFRPLLPDGEETPITVRHLLTHTAGLTYGFFQETNGSYQGAGVSDGLAEPGLSMNDELRRLASVPLCYRPGTAWGYSLAMDVLGEVLARVAGAPLPDVVERLVCGPLHLQDTGFAVRDPDRLAIPYVDGQPPRRMSDPDSVPMMGSDSGIRFSPSRIFDQRSFTSGGAGMAGTAGDLLTFLETMRLGGHPILKSDTVQQMMSNQINALRINVELTPAWGFGFGGAVLIDPELAGIPQAKGTWKWGGVYGHHWYVDPVHRLTVVAMTNTAVEGMTGIFPDALMRAVYGASATR